MIRFDHVVLRVSHIDDAAILYRAMFGFAGWIEVSDPKDGRSIGFRCADGLTVWLEETKDLELGDRLGWLDHYALYCDSREEVNRAYEFCRNQKWSIMSEPKGYPDYGSFYGFSFRGPDGIKLEFVTR